MFDSIKLLSNSKYVLLYGAGSIGREMLQYMKDDFNILGFAVTDELHVDEKYILNYKVDVIENWFEKYSITEVSVLITTSEQYHKSIINKLSQIGVKNFFALSRKIRDTIIETYAVKMFNKHGINLDDSVIELGNMRLINPLKPNYRFATNLFVQVGDFIFPSLFNDTSMMTEGPYEYDNVKVDSGDVVLDLGAIIGTFSSFAASKKCKVYAFEPTPQLQDVINKHSELNGNNIAVVPKAVSNVSGECELRICDYIADGNSIVMDNGYKNTVRVQTITVDEFVKENNIKVNFIKADIEGAERLMLAGAKNTLKDQAPKLSICTYHCKDDKEVLTNIILQANPNYKIKYNYEKLYAYVD